MKILDLVSNIKDVEIKGDNIDIKKLCYSTKDIEKDSLFFCIVGLKADGHSFINKAIEKGAKAVVVSKEVIVDENITVIRVKDTREAMSLISSSFYNNSWSRMKLIGLTGTNGKTTSTFIMRSILEAANKKSSLIGTICNMVGNKKYETERTTPESKDLQKLFKSMADENSDYCIMEVSSHSLDLKRVYGVNFEVGVFTNLTQDHLDYHSDMESYFDAKMKLFDNSKYKVINIDDEYGKKSLKMLNNNVITYGLNNNADIYASNIEMDKEGSKFKLNYKGKIEDIYINIPGKFNIYNTLACIGASIALDIPLTDIKKGLKNLKSVPGRSEKISSKKGFTVIIDYAHTPDGLENILSSTREYTKGKLIALFGCGGDRDKIKRPIMGEAAGKLADYCIITSDNPRTEDPKKIIDDIVPGIKRTNCDYVIIENRKNAIEYAINNAKENDIIVIAGKGHETYQVLADKTIHFDEKEIVKEFLKEEL